MHKDAETLRKKYIFYYLNIKKSQDDKKSMWMILNPFQLLEEVLLVKFEFVNVKEQNRL